MEKNYLYTDHGQTYYESWLFFERCEYLKYISQSYSYQSWWEIPNWHIFSQTQIIWITNKNPNRYPNKQHFHKQNHYATLLIRTHKHNRKPNQCTWVCPNDKTSPTANRLFHTYVILVIEHYQWNRLSLLQAHCCLSAYLSYGRMIPKVIAAAQTNFVKMFDHTNSHKSHTVIYPKSPP